MKHREHLPALKNIHGIQSMAGTGGARNGAGRAIFLSSGIK
jgi:hypothetical protein